MKYLNDTAVMKRMNLRLKMNKVWKAIFIVATTFALITLLILLIRIFSQGLSHLNLNFLSNFASRVPEKAGIKAALIGSLWLMAVVAPVSILLGVSSAIYLEEYAKKKSLQRFYSY